MKKILVSIIVLVAIVFSYFYFTPSAIQVEETKVETPNKPASVPADTFWAGGIDGGNFIKITVDSTDPNAVSAEIYNDSTGDIEYDGLMEYSGPDGIPEAVSDPSFIHGWDGYSLHLANGHSLTAVEP
ncbi:hypothetical protein ACJO2E_12735 [Marinobacter sp. M1N3S26]|uniref:hypothetical protein n=1 Tax=Marinobacter sp. M1N3S26 TaxID=3382299 RepID=UPI00387AB8FC